MKELIAFKDFLDHQSNIQEMSVAMLGDWDMLDPDYEVIHRGIHYINRYFSKILKEIKIGSQVYELREHKDSKGYIMGFFEEVQEKFDLKPSEKFRTSVLIELEGANKIEKALNKINPQYNRIVNVNGIFIEEKLRNAGLGTKLYRFLVNEVGFVIMGDKHQHFGARKLWSKLSNQNDLLVDIVDIKNLKVIEKSVRLKHGNKDKDIDSRLWSLYPDTSKEHIRPILRKLI